ncbi:MAG: hypothetical protein WCA47_03595 [Terriglobales bacterium]
MTRVPCSIRRPPLRSTRCAALLLAAIPLAVTQIGIAQEKAQAAAVERTYHQPKVAVEKALKELQPSLAGHLPVLDGFALPGDHPLNRYQRAYYQSAVQMSSTAAGGTLVRVTTKVTAWYADSNPSHSGYQLLASNGRLESDLLDQLTDLLASKSSPADAVAYSRAAAGENSGQNSGQNSGHGSSQGSALGFGAPSSNAAVPSVFAHKAAAEPALSAPLPQSSENGRGFSSLADQGLSSQQLANSRNSLPPPDQSANPLRAEAANLEEVLKNQAHPKNLVAVKKSGTPVVATPSLSGKTLFLASAHDEFEMLDFNADWVHVRISGLSRGWIWRTSLEMPEGISDVPPASPTAAPVVADLFQVTREETAPFPGDWEPLRGKNVKIISVQKIQENEANSGAQAKLEFAKSLLDKSYAELAAQPQDLSGIVLIFDSVDGGMIGATLPTVQAWKAGKLSDAALWHQCYFDPPETFVASSPSAGH